jgi:AraC family transcriptional regulator of adaptative response/methylated-DNA-[protein]-cysteine methyltransferase
MQPLTSAPQAALRARASGFPPAGADFDPEDYRRVCGAIAYLTENRLDQPALAAVAAEMGLSEAHFQRLFKRWAGLSPKEFLQALTLDHARALLRDSASVLDTALEVGLSGPGRLHDLFVAFEAMSPGEYKAGGAGLTIVYGFHPSPFGEALVMASPRGLAGLAFADSAEERSAVLADMTGRWPRADFVEDKARTSALAARIFNRVLWKPGEPLRVVLIGTDFEVRVWRTLLKIPLGRATTYGDIAAHLGQPKAARAVGAAVGRNPLSFVVPCHRVLGKAGSLTGYRWGLTRKRAIIGWEAGLAKGA